MELRYIYIPSSKTTIQTKYYDDHYIAYGTKICEVLSELYHNLGNTTNHDIESFSEDLVYDNDELYLLQNKAYIYRKILILSMSELQSIWESSISPQGIPSIIFYAVKANSRIKVPSGSIYLNISIATNDRKKLFI